MVDAVQAVAANIRRIRRGRDLSLNQLAAESGIAKGTLAQLEAGRGNPTVTTLMALATHLGVTLADLISDTRPTAIHLTRSSEGSLVRGDGLQLRLMHRMATSGTLYEIYDMQVAQGMYHSAAHAPGVMEHLFVSRGTLRVGPVDDVAVLDQHDFISFCADCPHLYEAIDGNVEATLMVLYPLSANGTPLR